MSIEQMQNEIMKLGFIFTEQTFPDDTVILHFKKTKAFNPYSRNYEIWFPYSSDGWHLGWGRFNRLNAWQMAYNSISNHGKDMEDYTSYDEEKFS